MSENEMQFIREKLHDLAQEVAKGDQAHNGLKELLEGHIKESKNWRESTDSQMQAIAQALLQDKARDDVVSEQEEKWSNKKLVWWTTGVVAAATLLTNFDGVIGVIKKVLAIF